MIWTRFASETEIGENEAQRVTRSALRLPTRLGVLSRGEQVRMNDAKVVATFVLALGVGAAVGAVWMFTHPQERRVAAPVARLDFGIAPGGLSVAGTF